MNFYFFIQFCGKVNTRKIKKLKGSLEDINSKTHISLAFPNN